MEPEGSLPSSQAPTNCPYPQHTSVMRYKKIIVQVTHFIYTITFVDINKHIFMSVPFNRHNGNTINQSTCSFLCEYSKHLLLLLLHVKKKKGMLYMCKP